MKLAKALAVITMIAALALVGCKPAIERPAAADSTADSTVVDTTIVK